MELHISNFLFTIERNEDAGIGYKFKIGKKTFTAESLSAATSFIEEVVDNIPEGARKSVLHSHAT